MSSGPIRRGPTTQTRDSSPPPARPEAVARSAFSPGIPSAAPSHRQLSARPPGRIQGHREPRAHLPVLSQQHLRIYKQYFTHAQNLIQRTLQWPVALKGTLTAVSKTSQDLFATSKPASCFLASSGPMAAKLCKASNVLPTWRPLMSDGTFARLIRLRYLSCSNRDRFLSTAPKISQHMLSHQRHPWQSYVSQNCQPAP